MTENTAAVSMVSTSRRHQFKDKMNSMWMDVKSIVMTWSKTFLHAGICWSSQSPVRGGKTVQADHNHSTGNAQAGIGTK